MVLGALHKATIRFFQTWSRFCPMCEGPYGERDRFAEEAEEGFMLESGAHGAGQVCDRKKW